MLIGAGAVGGGAGGDESGTGPSPPLPPSMEQDALPSVGPLPHHQLPSPTAGE